MFDVDNAFKELNSYCALERNLELIVNNLNIAIDNLEKADYASKNYFLINDSNFDNNDIIKLKNRLIDYRNYLNNTCKNAAYNNKKRMINTIEGEGITIIWN